jgi:hypothetical protein
MNGTYTKAERAHVGRVKELPCGVCNQAAPSAAHHIEQHRHYLTIPLCADCHQGAKNGIHGQKNMWRIMGKTELSVLNDTIEKLMA